MANWTSAACSALCFTVSVTFTVFTVYTALRKTTDWRWLWGDPDCLVVFDVLEKACLKDPKAEIRASYLQAKLLSPHGLEIAEEAIVSTGEIGEWLQQRCVAKVRFFLNPPQEEPPPEPQAVLGPGMQAQAQVGRVWVACTDFCCPDQIGRLALLGVPIVLSGVVRAKGPAAALKPLQIGHWFGLLMQGTGGDSTPICPASSAGELRALMRLTDIGERNAESCGGEEKALFLPHGLTRWPQVQRLPGRS